MIRRIRSSGTIRQAWVIFALAAFMLRAATPAGYMLGADPETGGSWIYLCQPLVSGPSTGKSMPMSMGKSMGAMDHSAPMQHHPGQGHFDSSCAFTMAGTALNPDAPAITAGNPDYRVAEAPYTAYAAPLAAPLNRTAPPRAPPAPGA
jgi:hypothetical protein